MERLQKYLKKQGFLAEDIAKVLPYFQMKMYHAGEYLLNMGENTRQVCFILEGVVRGVYLDAEGQEITKCFTSENGWCCVYNFLKNQPSQIDIQALEDCKVACIGIEELKVLIKKDSNCNILYMHLCTKAMMDVDERTGTFQKMDAAGRYNRFVERYPELVQRVKQEYIASFIGVTPSSLSRLKRTINNNI